MFELNRNERVQMQLGDVVMIRSSMGQVTEYDVYRITGRKYLGGGTKREAKRLFNAAVKS
jgi:hypothetical protein